MLPPLLSFWSGDLPPAARMLISVLSFCEYLELLVLLMKITRHRLIVGHLPIFL
jgi:hypothetical protein